MCVQTNGLVPYRALDGHLEGHSPTGVGAIIDTSPTKKGHRKLCQGILKSENFMELHALLSDRVLAIRSLSIASPCSLAHTGRLTHYLLAEQAPHRYVTNGTMQYRDSEGRHWATNIESLSWEWVSCRRRKSVALPKKNGVSDLWR